VTDDLDYELDTKYYTSARVVGSFELMNKIFSIRRRL
jgi:hypothetical protein